MSFAPIFMVIFVISKLQYVGIRSFKAIGGILLSEIHRKKILNKIQKKQKKIQKAKHNAF